MFTIFLLRFNVTVTSQSDVPILAYLRLESVVLWITAGINMNCLISCGNCTGDMLILEHRHWLWILKRLHLLQNDVCTWKNDVSTEKYM